MKVRKAVIPVAGLGTRFLPVTKVVPKELLPLLDYPTIHYIVEEAFEAGIRDIIFVTAAGKSAVEDYFDRSRSLEYFLEKKGNEEKLALVRRIADMVDVIAVRQKSARGLGHAVLCAKDLVGPEPFAVLLGDDLMDHPVPATRQLLDAFDVCGRAVVGVVRVPESETYRYGVVDPESSDGRLHKLRGMVEKPPSDPPSNMAIIGRYVFPPEIFSYIERTPPGAQGEIQLTDAMKMLNDASGVYAYEVEGRRLDAGNVLGFLEANLVLALKRPDLAGDVRALMRGLLERPE
ncbi:MAG: UTP--glucose-1-phosphate uridylyltransferase GalU [Deltaproteobacteria bacterium]|nr:UTP--glucose-1-phosphate uridylyltransferase GalU [Deltaproteobacteria bacterium]